MKRLVPFFLLASSTVFAGPGPKDGSAFDLEMAFPTPGSLGRFVVDGKNLRLQKDPRGSRRTLVGTNLTGMACFPTSDSQAAAWAKDLARRGYNCVRLHHIDWVIRDRGWGFKANADRFIAALKKEGIYVAIDLFSDRAQDRNGFKRGVLEGDSRIRADWAGYAKRLLTQSSGARGCLAWKDEPAIFGITPLNEDDPRFLGANPSKYDSAYRWMLKVVRDTGYDGLVWGLNSGVDPQFSRTASIFNVEDFHVYWDHPQGDESLDTSGVRQHWQFPVRRISSRPWITTEWGSLPYNRLRGETGLFFAAQMAVNKASAVMSFALATNESMMSSAKAPIDQYGFHTDPVRLATDRAMVLLLRKPASDARVSWNRESGTYSYDSSRYKIRIAGEGSNRDADFLGSLDGLSTSTSKRLLLLRFGDAQNSGYRSRLVRDRVVFKVENRGGTPVREIPNGTPYEIRSSRRLRAWDLDPYTGARTRELQIRETRPDVWSVRVQGINTEIVGS
jgi:hypothetical protein